MQNKLKKMGALIRQLYGLDPSLRFSQKVMVKAFLAASSRSASPAVRRGDAVRDWGNRREHGTLHHGSCFL